MFNILLVDDEKLMIDSLVNFVDWKSMDMNIVGTAKNGRDALEKVDKLKPHIVLTDVRMPIMDGIEFSRKVREHNKNLKIVFLSGYDEFKYAKAAIDVDACGYILKPIEYDELYDILGKVKSKCEIDNYSLMAVENVRQCYLRQLLAEKSKDNAKEIINRSENSQVINKIISILKNNYNKVISADDLSKEIYLTPNYIRTIFKNYTGETILKYHTKLRMEKAIELLSDRSQKIHDISNSIGYENISYFCSLFSKYYGMTPNEYRKKYFGWEVS